MKAVDVSHHDRDTVLVKHCHGTSDSQPIYEKKSFHTDNMKSSGEENLINLSEDINPKNNDRSNKEFDLDPTDSNMSSDVKTITEVTPKVSAKQRKKFKKEARQLAKKLEPLASIKEENEDEAEEVLVEPEEPSAELFPPLSRTSDMLVVRFPDPNITREWL